MANRVANQDGAQLAMDFAIVSAKLTIEAMRDSGYKDTDHALAELIDNSVEANSRLIEVIAVETPPDPHVRFDRARITQIAVVDNGHGMTPDVLRRALKFGDGTRKDRKTSRGIGRFGVGLPQSSISQCKRVDVWTWKSGVDNALHCYLDLDEINEGGVQVVPEPDERPVPDQWRYVASNTGASRGTLVVWSQLDRVRWSGGAKTLARTEELCGRIYRKYIVDQQRPVQIDMVLANATSNSVLEERERRTCLPNDPLYLMVPASTPPPFDDRPMFQVFNTRTWTIKANDTEGDICVRCSMATADAINEKKSAVPWPQSYSKAGDAPWGKHANRNKGISIVRARRELELSLAWVNNYEPEERWWAVEVEFDPILDEIFGVVNNKQHAHAFVEGAGFDLQQRAEERGETVSEYREHLKNTDLSYYLIDIWIWIDNQIKAMRKERKKLMRGTGTARSHPKTGVDLEDSATDVINEQAANGEKGRSDTAPPATDKEKTEAIVNSVPNGVPPDTAREWADETVSNARRVLLKAVDLHNRDAFFAVESVNDVIEVWLNERHPVHEHLIDVLQRDADAEDESREELASRLRDAAFALWMLLVAWARHEDKAPANLRQTLEDLRMDWGREARRFLEVIET